MFREARFCSPEDMPVTCESDRAEDNGVKVDVSKGPELGFMGVMGESTAIQERGEESEGEGEAEELGDVVRVYYIIIL